MSTVVIRGKKGDDFFGGIRMTDEKRRRIREHLISVGVRVDRLQPLIWPEDAVSAYKRHMYAPWEYTLKSDILRRKRERMELNLRWKREDGVIHRRPLYVWVFWCPGINGIFYRGWWLYLIGRDIESGRYFEKSELCSRVMELFPIIEPMLFEEDWQQRKRWKAEFVKRYQRGKWCGKPQGKAPIWAEVNGSSILKILARAQWSKKTA